MVISKELEWIREYVGLVAHMLPHIRQLKRVSSRKASKKLVQRCHGIINRYADKRHFKITLYLTSSNVVKYRPLKIEVTSYNTIEILYHLAHELSHLEHWEHTPDRKHLEAVLMTIFMQQLKSTGYISEEDEEARTK